MGKKPPDLKIVIAGARENYLQALHTDILSVEQPLIESPFQFNKNLIWLKAIEMRSVFGEREHTRCFFHSPLQNIFGYNHKPFNKPITTMAHTAQAIAFANRPEHSIYFAFKCTHKSLSSLCVADCIQKLLNRI